MSLKKSNKYNRKSDKVITDDDVEKNERKAIKRIKGKKSTKPVEAETECKKFLKTLDVFMIKVGHRFAITKEVNGEIFVDYSEKDRYAVKFYNEEVLKDFCKNHRIKNYSIVSKKRG